jgi:hypothetical protein
MSPVSSLPAAPPPATAAEVRPAALSSLNAPTVEVATAALRRDLRCASADAVAAVLQRHAAALRPDRVAAWCRTQNIELPVYRGLAALNAPQASALRTLLAPRARALIGTSLYEADRLRTLLHAFHNAGIPVLPLKGVSLDAWLYDGPGRRRAGDHDLLVPARCVPEAARLLKAEGYACTDPAWTPASLPPDKHHAPPFVAHPDGPASMVELHWAVEGERTPSLIDTPQAFTKALWDRARETSLLGVPVQRMAPVDERLYLCLHAFKHLTMHGGGLSLRVSMLADLARHASYGPPVDPHALAQRLAGLGPNDLCSPLRALWVQGLGGTPGELLPDTAVPTDRWPNDAWAQAVVSMRLLLAVPDHPDDQERLYGHRLRRILTHAALLTRWRDRLRLLQTDVMPRLWAVNEHDRRFVPAGAHWPAPALLPLRWGRLLWNILRR